MPIGDVQVYSSGVVNGEVFYESSLTSIRLGGLGNPSTQSIILSPPQIGRVKLALLEIGVRHRTPHIVKWRVWLDGIAITREFKPNQTITLEDSYYSKCVFDVTPIYDSSRAQHHVTLKYEGSETLIIEHVGLLLVYEVEGSRTVYSFASGALALQPGEEAHIELPITRLDVNKQGPLLVKSTLVLPSRRASVRIKVEQVEKTIKGFIGASDVDILLPSFREKVAIRIIHENTHEPYYPRHVIVSSLLAYAGVSRRPNIELEVVREDANSIELLVRNTGNAKPDKLLLVVIQAGNVIDRRMLEPLEPGSEARVRVVKQKPLLLRVVWNYRGENQFKDLRI